MFFTSRSCLLIHFLDSKKSNPSFSTHLPKYWIFRFKLEWISYISQRSTSKSSPNRSKLILNTSVQNGWKRKYLRINTGHHQNPKAGLWSLTPFGLRVGLYGICQSKRTHQSAKILYFSLFAMKTFCWIYQCFQQRHSHQSKRHEVLRGGTFGSQTFQIDKNETQIWPFLFPLTYYKQCCEDS